MNASLSTMWWEGRADVPASIAQRTRALGFEQVELEYRIPPEVLPALRTALRQNGLSVSSLHSPFPSPAPQNPLRLANLAAEEEADRRRAQTLVERTLEEAARWGAPVIVLHAGNIESLRPLERRLQDLYRAGAGKKGAAGPVYRRLQVELRYRRAEHVPRHLERVQQALARLAPRAHALGVAIALENRAYFGDLPSLTEMGLLLEEFGPTVGYWHDTGHAYRLSIMGFTPQEEWLQRYGPLLRGIHLHDSIGLSDHRPPGQGEVPLARLAGLLPEKACRVMEVDPEHGEEALAAGLDHLRAIGVLR